MCGEETRLCLYTRLQSHTNPSVYHLHQQGETQGTSCHEQQQSLLSSTLQSPKWPPHMLSLPGFPANSCSRLQPEQAGHSVHRWFGFSCSKFSRHLNKSQQSFLSYPLPQSANAIQNCGGLIRHCFSILNEVLFPRIQTLHSSPSLSFMKTTLPQGLI